MNTLTPFRSLFPFSRSTWADDVDRLWRGFLPWVEENGSSWTPSLDLIDKPKAYVVKLEVPGMQADDLHVEVTGDVLTVRGERRQEEKTEHDQYRLTERRYGAFCRTVAFPAAVDPDHVEARLEDGVLTVQVAKAKAAKAAQVKVKA
jgi:HSP20 family protein